jgi:hypothetical protein
MAPKEVPVAFTDEKRPDEFHVVPVKLYENYLPKAMEKGKYFAKTAHERTLKIEDLASLIVERRGTRWKYAELVEVFHLLCREICIQLCDGYAINLADLFLLYPHIKHMFERIMEGITDEDHPIVFHFRALSELYEASKHIKINVVGAAESRAFLDTFTDLGSGLVNQRVTSGGQFAAEGNMVRLEGDGAGFFFVSSETPAVEVPVTAPFARNKESELISVVPDLPPGREWTLEIRTRFSGGGRLLKNLRVIRSGFTVLSV